MTNRLNYTEPGTGKAVSTEEQTIESVIQHLQRVKLGLGVTGGYQNDLSYGQAVAGSSLPVVVSSDQVATAVVSPTGADPGIKIRSVGPIGNNLGQKATYMSSTSGSIVMSTTTNTVTSMAYLWHPNSSTKRVSLQKILFSFAGGASGIFNVFVNRVSGENVTPSGTSQIINKQDQDDVNSTCTFRTSANTPARVPGDYVCMTFGGGSEGLIDLVDILEGKGYICRASQAEGWEVRTSGSGLSASPNCGITFVWVE